MHIPESISDETRKKFQQLILSLFKGQNVTVLYAALLTCPWYARTQRERGEQAKHNIIFIIFKCGLAQYLSPISSHVHEQANVIDKGWFTVTELYHFCHYLCKGKTRNVEALYCPVQAVLYEDPQWNSLRTGLNISQTIGLRGFLEACRGQSVGGIGKKGKDGKFRIKDSTTFKALCDSFRLMHHAHNTLNGQPLCLDTVDESQLPSVAQEAVTVLRDMYQNLDISKKDVFEFLEQWQRLVSLQVKKFNFTDPEEVYRIVGNWQMVARLQGNPIRCLSSCAEDEHLKLLSLMEDIKGPMSHLRPEQILMATRAGSHMYDLSMATSDIDYVIIYADPSEKILTACKKLPESIEDRGPQKKIEYGAYEVRCFCEMLMKGSVVILELLFRDGHNYTHPAWKTLADQKSLFVTERGIQQYMGLIRNNISMLQKEKLKDNKKERKLFYQIFHKMESVEYLMKGMIPPVKCSGPVRDFIMRIRTAPLEGDLQRDKLYEYCMDRYERLKENLANRRYRLKENADFKFLLNWLLSVRGLDNIP
ncbi:hypothetical protein ACJMK2_034270 [Sinanodonta woodiana]|uniref:Uncharacterized protein n=1 Tax=Sinanodonta woodiana TaxID=1069815 RepID=A0ABD3WSH3_SINWO